jgi:hypothetical protein
MPVVTGDWQVLYDDSCVEDDPTLIYVRPQRELRLRDYLEAQYMALVSW